jgi:hypothetical protein
LQTGVFNRDVSIKFAGVDQPKVVKITGETLDSTAYDTYVKSQQAEKDKTTKSKSKD